MLALKRGRADQSIDHGRRFTVRLAGGAEVEDRMPREPPSLALQHAFCDGVAVDHDEPVEHEHGVVGGFEQGTIAFGAVPSISEQPTHRPSQRHDQKQVAREHRQCLAERQCQKRHRDRATDAQHARYDQNDERPPG